MSITVIILLVVAAIIALVLIIAIFTSKEYIVQQQIIINQPTPAVFSYIKLMDNQNHYNKWWMMDPNAKKEYSGTDGTLGYTMKWESDNKQAGKGEQEITKITEGAMVEYEIRFIKPFQAVSPSYIETTTAGGGKTRVVWIFKGSRNYGMRLFHLLFNLKKMLGKDLQASLVNLKSILEK